MKKRESNKVEALLQELYYNNDLLKYAEKLRPKVGLPKEGLATSEKSRGWLENNNERHRRYFDVFFGEFVPFAKKHIKHPTMLTSPEWDRVLSELFLVGSVRVSRTAYDMRFSGFEHIIVDRGEVIADIRRIGPIEDGVYIKISPYATEHKIRQFIKENISQITMRQTIFRILKDMPNPPTLKSSGNFERNLAVAYLMRSTKKELEKEYGERGNTIYEVISEILYKQGFRTVTPDTVKRAYSRLVAKKVDR